MYIHQLFESLVELVDGPGELVIAQSSRLAKLRESDPLL
jgi:hypothetical protein